MKIQCLLERPGGTKVTIGPKEYNFRPDKLGRHVCDVSDTKDAQRFLAITEGYTLIGEDEVPAKLKGSVVPEQPVVQPEPERQEDGVVETESAPEEDADEYRTRLVEEYTEAYGRLPKANMKTETIAAKLGYGQE